MPLFALIAGRRRIAALATAAVPCGALTILLAALSWHLVERPALDWRRPLRQSAAEQPLQQPARG